MNKQALTPLRSVDREKGAEGYALSTFFSVDEKRTIHELQNRANLFVANTISVFICCQQYLLWFSPHSLPYRYVVLLQTLFLVFMRPSFEFVPFVADKTEMYNDMGFF